MGAASSNPIRFGKDFTQASPAFDDLWLPVYAGEVLLAFDENFLAKEFVRLRTLTSGNEEKFPRLGQAEAERHEAGQELLGLDVQSAEVTITLDDRPLVWHMDLDDIDLAMSHYEVRSELASEGGKALARAQDRLTFKLIANAAKTPQDGNSEFPGGGPNEDGQPFVSSDYPAVGNSGWTRDQGLRFLEDIKSVLVSWDENDIPQEDRNCIVSPSLWWALKTAGVPFSDTDLATGMTKVFGNTAGDFGTPQTSMGIQNNPGRRMPLMYEGVNIWQSNFLPITNVTTGEVKYRGDFTNLRALLVQRQAVGHLTMMDVMVETDRDVRRQSDFYVTKMLTGGGTIRPEAAVAFEYDATA